jgi:ribosomal protein L12E/L44/L45/RPP1/RPP2
MILREAEADLRQIWSFLSARQIWAPYPIRAYSLASAFYRDDKLLASYFLFPVEKPALQSQAVAQLVCKFVIEGESVTAKLVVDALGESELTEENIADIRLALGSAQAKSTTRAHNHYERGLRAFDSKRFNEAIKELDECLCANPDRLLILNDLPNDIKRTIQVCDPYDYMIRANLSEARKVLQSRR